MGNPNPYPYGPISLINNETTRQYALETHERDMTAGRSSKWGFPLYEFPTDTWVYFTPCEAAGYVGPTYNQCVMQYAGNPHFSSWVDNPDFFDVSGPGGNSLYTTASVHPVGYQMWTVPQDGSYTIQATGGTGGRQWYSPEAAPVVLGAATASGTFDLNKNDKLIFVVGQYGYSHGYNAGGGGGSFAVKVVNGFGDIPVFHRDPNFDGSNPYSSNVTRLVIAGGSGGVKTEGTDNRPSGVGQSGFVGGSANGAGGTGGQGGFNQNSSVNSSGGAGYYSNTRNPGSFNTLNYTLWSNPGAPLNGAFAFLTGARGSQTSPTYGGFGGGGHGSYTTNDDDDGGGGGYSGGGHAFDSYYAGGGGGSYVNPIASSPSTTAGPVSGTTNGAHGQILVKLNS